jgi:hypothetical protein
MNQEQFDRDADSRYISEGCPNCQPTGDDCLESASDGHGSTFDLGVGVRQQRVAVEILLETKKCRIWLPFDRFEILTRVVLETHPLGVRLISKIDERNSVHVCMSRLRAAISIATGLDGHKLFPYTLNGRFAFAALNVHATRGECLAVLDELSPALRRRVAELPEADSPVAALVRVTCRLHG